MVWCAWTWSFDETDASTTWDLSTFVGQYDSASSTYFSVIEEITLGNATRFVLPLSALTATLYNLI